MLFCFFLFSCLVFCLREGISKILVAIDFFLVVIVIVVVASQKSQLKLLYVNPFDDTWLKSLPDCPQSFIYITSVAVVNLPLGVVGSQRIFEIEVKT